MQPHLVKVPAPQRTLTWDGFSMQKLKAPERPLLTFGILRYYSCLGLGNVGHCGHAVSWGDCCVVQRWR